MGSFSNPFLRLSGSLPPLIPKPDPMSISTESQDSPMMEDRPLQAFPSRAQKSAPNRMDQIQAMPDPFDQMKAHLQDRLMGDYQKDQNPYGSPSNHPGALGKTLHVLSKIGNIAGDVMVPGQMAEIPGTDLHRHLQESGLEKSLQEMLNSQSGNVQKEAQANSENATAGKTNADIPLEEAETKQREQQIAANEPVEITPEQAQALGMPELAGEKVSPAILARLSGQHQGNTTKEDTTKATVQGRESVAQTGATSKEKIAGEQIQSREKIAAEDNAVKAALEHMRIASGIGKGEQGPTMTTRAMAEMATTVLPRMTAISAEVDKMANDLGPAVGRWNELMVNKGGVDHPEFAHLDTDLDLLASAIVRTHFGARGGQQYRAELRKQFGEAQSPEDLKERIAAAQDWIQGYANMDNAPASGGSSGQPGGPPAGAKIRDYTQVGNGR